MDPRVETDRLGTLFELASPPRPPKYLRTPLHVSAQHTVQGYVGFYIPEYVLREFGIDEERLKEAVSRRTSGIETWDMALEITDYVSGSVVTMAVPGLYETQKEGE